MTKLPAAHERFQRIHRRVWEAYDRLGAAVHREGPLDAKTRELVKLGMAIGGRLEGAVRSHSRRAIEEGAPPGEIAHVVSLAVTTVGFPTAVAAFTWVEDALKRGAGRRKKKRTGIRSERRPGMGAPHLSQGRGTNGARAGGMTPALAEG